jgi:hypothetical protein
VRALALAAILLTASTAHALGPLETTVDQAVRLDTGIDRGLTSFISYNRILRANLALEVRFGLPLVVPDPLDSELSVGAEVRLLDRRSFQLRGQLDLFERTTENGIFTGLELGGRATVRAGYFRCAYFVAAELGVEQGFATYIHHTDWYRETAYPDAEDGWLANSATIFKPAVLGGGHITPRILLGGRLALDLDRSGHHGYLPIVLTASLAYAF